MYPISTISDILRQGVDSFGPLVRALDFYPGDHRRSKFESRQGHGIFQSMHHLLVTNFPTGKNVNLCKIVMFVLKRRKGLAFIPISPAMLYVTVASASPSFAVNVITESPAIKH